MYRAQGARLRLNFDEQSDSSQNIGHHNTGPGHHLTVPDPGGWQPQPDYWSDLPQSPRKAPASPRRTTPYSPRKPKSRAALHLQAHDSILGTPLCDSRGNGVYPMHCTVTLQRLDDERRYVLTVIAFRDDSDFEPLYSGATVATSSVAKNIRSGSLQVSVSSDHLSPEYREQLHKTEHNWDGTDVEKQFVLKLKPGCSLSGIFGAVTVSSVSGADAGTSCFHLRLVLPAEPKPIANPNSSSSASSSGQPEDVSWGAAAFKELACHLRLLDECEDWRCLARDLGFTEHEISTKLAPAPDPFAAMLSTYRARGGTPDELLRGMYSCSRMRGLQVVGSTSPNKGPLSQGASLSASSATQGSSATQHTLDDPDLDKLVEAAALNSRRTSSSTNRRTTKSSELSHAEAKPLSLARTGYAARQNSDSGLARGSHSVHSRSSSNHSKPSNSGHAKPVSMSRQGSMTQHSVGRSECNYDEDEEDVTESEGENDDACETETIPVSQLSVGRRRGVEDLPLTPPATPLRRLAVSSTNRRPTKSSELSHAGAKPLSLARTGYAARQNSDSGLARGSHSVHSRSSSNHSKPSNSGHAKPVSMSRQGSMTQHSVGRSECNYDEDEEDVTESEGENDDACETETIPVSQLSVGRRHGVEDLPLTPPATPLRRLAVSRQDPGPRAKNIFVFPN